MKIILKLALTFLILLFFLSQVSAQDSLYLKNPNFSYETGLYKIYKTGQKDIVMLGNSITHGANWNELLGRDDVVERGIPSDITAGFLNRMEYIYNLNPKVVFILGGINDIYNWTPVDTIMLNYIRIVKKLQARGITPVIQSTLYAGKGWHSSEERNTEVKKLNRLLRKFARDNNIKFIDLNSKMSENGFLKPGLSRDSLHLNPAGFAIWRDEVEKALTEMGY